MVTPKKVEKNNKKVCIFGYSGITIEFRMVTAL